VALSQVQGSPALMLGGLVILALAAYGVWAIVSGSESETQTTAVEAPVEDAAEPAPSEEAAAQPGTPSPTNAEASTGTEPTGPAAEVAPEETPEEAPAAAEDQVPPEADVASTGEEVVEESPPQEAAAEAEGQAGKIVVRARLESWIQVTNEKKDVLFSRVLRSGETYTVPEEKGLMLTTGNAGGIEILVDGKKLKSLGTVGLVKRDIQLDPKKLQDGSAFKTTKAAPVTN
jgi:cytoskeleton protein RodZ